MNPLKTFVILLFFFYLPEYYAVSSLLSANATLSFFLLWASGKGNCFLYISEPPFPQAVTAIIWFPSMGSLRRWLCWKLLKWHCQLGTEVESLHLEFYLRSSTFCLQLFAPRNISQKVSRVKKKIWQENVTMPSKCFTSYLYCSNIFYLSSHDYNLLYFKHCNVTGFLSFQVLRKAWETKKSITERAWLDSCHQCI